MYSPDYNSTDIFSGKINKLTKEIESLRHDIDALKTENARIIAHL
jgi:outer membrane murein-binding lipoprotein Lpp